jgi:hypothetical protein
MMKRWPMIALFCLALVIEHLAALVKDWAKKQIVPKDPEDDDDEDEDE